MSSLLVHSWAVITARLHDTFRFVFRQSFSATAGRYRLCQAASPPAYSREPIQKGFVCFCIVFEQPVAHLRCHTGVPLLHVGVDCSRRTVFVPMLGCIVGHECLPTPGAEHLRARNGCLGTGSRVQDRTGSAFFSSLCQSVVVKSSPTLLLRVLACTSWVCSVVRVTEGSFELPRHRNCVTHGLQDV